MNKFAQICRIHIEFIHLNYFWKIILSLFFAWQIFLPNGCCKDSIFVDSRHFDVFIEALINVVENFQFLDSFLLDLSHPERFRCGPKQVFWFLLLLVQNLFHILNKYEHNIISSTKLKQFATLIFASETHQMLWLAIL